MHQEPPPNVDWYADLAGEPHGPASFEQLQLWARAGLLRGVDRVWQGDGSPRQASEVPGLIQQRAGTAPKGRRRMLGMVSDVALIALILVMAVGAFILFRQPVQPAAPVVAALPAAVPHPPPVPPQEPAAPKVPPTSGVRVLNDGTEIELTGPIVAGSAAQFRTALEAVPRVRVVHLDSPGGLIGEAVQIADLVRTHNLDTYDRRFCASACTLIFMAGRARWLDPYASMGFHSPSGTATEVVVAKAIFRMAFAAAGVPADFARTALETSAQDLWHPPNAALMTEHVATGFAQPLHMAMSGFGPTPDAAKAIQRLNNQPGIAKLRHADRHWADVEDIWARTVNEGLTPVEFEAVLKAHAVSVGQQPPSLLGNGYLLPDFVIRPSQQPPVPASGLVPTAGAGSSGHRSN